MESTQELRHWGIKGMRWGIRRYQNEDGTLTEAGKKRYYYQNPDGSLTEEGKKNYMTGAKKGKIDPKKLSDADLNMINSRFARENTFKQNVENYQKSKFSYKAKEALLARIKGNGGGGGGGGKKGGGTVSKLLAMPIKKAFEDAFKFNPNSSGNDNGGGDDGYNEAREFRKNGHRFITGADAKYNEKTAVKALRDSDVDRGRMYLGHGKGKMGVSDSTFKLGSTDATRTGNAGAQRKLEERRRARESASYNSSSAGKATRAEANRQKQEAARRKRERELEERAAKSGIYLGHNGMKYRISRDNLGSDELMHYGIKGQKWGVRRFENVDGTLTAAGKERYGAGREFDNKVKKSEFQNDPELKELYKMEKKELTNGDYRSERKRIAANRPDGLSSKEKLVVDRIQNGEVVDDETIRKIASDHHDEYFALGKKLQVTTDETERKAILKQMDDQRHIMDYAYDQIPTLNRENKYEKNLATREDKQSIDPSYRMFSSKAEKAKAEEEYLKNTWYEEDVSKVSGDECQHIFDRVCNLSFNGYDGKPQSDRARSMFDYDPNGYRDYERWVPKYEKSDEWKQIQSERQMLKDKTGYTKAENDFNSASISGAFKTDRKLYDKLSKALSDAQRKYSKRVDASDIKQREHKIEKAFDTEMTKVVLKDLGYEITEANMKYIEGIIWWD